MTAKRKNSEQITQNINVCGNLFLLLGFVFFFFAIFGLTPKGEANIGTFDAYSFDSQWTVDDGTHVTVANLPIKVDAQTGDRIRIKNTIPSYVGRGMRLMLHSYMEDVYIYIDGQLREQYCAEDIFIQDYYTISAYVVTDLTKEDAGKPIEIVYDVKSEPLIQDIYISYGNNAWYNVIVRNAPVVCAALVLVIVGFASILAHAILHKRISKSAAILYLGQMLIPVGMWIISESGMRQLIFKSPSYSAIFAYVFIEVIGVFAALFFDEIQGHRYRKWYTIIEIADLSVLGISIILAIAKIFELYQTLILFHIVLVLELILSIVTLILDYRDKHIKQYGSIAGGFVVLVVCCVLELLDFYLNSNHIFGIILSIGLLIMLVATILQVVSDEVKRVNERRFKQEELTMTTIETIAGALDAKDEYTGGHSFRVADYAVRLAREVAEQYNFTQEDFDRIRYIGKLHDIGKISVPDHILNKPGKLTDDEYNLMKKHTSIGYLLLQNMDGVDGLAEGIRYHHERFDGKGYPDGLKGEEIPLYARILCLADSFDAMTTDRVYRKSLSGQEIRQELEKGKGSQFDPYLETVFCEMFDTGKLYLYVDEAENEKENTCVGYLNALLVKDLMAPTYRQIKHTSQIRMMSYIVKLCRKRSIDVAILAITIQEKTPETLSAASWDECQNELRADLKSEMRSSDLSVAYCDNMRLLVLFKERTMDADAIRESLLEKKPGRYEIEIIR